MKRWRLCDLWGGPARMARAFLRARNANVAVIFALSLVPMAVAAGAGIDLARAVMVRSELRSALDAAGLAVGSAQGLNPGQLQTLAQKYFEANFTETAYGTPKFSTTEGNGTVQLKASLEMPTTLMSLVGIKSMPVSFTSTIVWGQTKLWVSLVLDNTGSMCEPDSQPCTNDTNPNIKINALKTASHDLLTMLKNASANSGDVKVSIVPFTTDVSIKGLSLGGMSYKHVPWIDWSLMGGSCNIYGIRNEAQCTHTHGVWQTSWWSSGCTIQGYYNKTSCENATGTWTMNNSNWQGCITDRDQNYDVQNTTPNPSNSATLYPADPSSSCPIALQPLTDVISGWNSLTTEIDNMTAGGGTNQTIGLVWGWQTLTNNEPLNPGTLPQETQRVIILLSDGLNTKDRWYGNGYSHSPQVDTRMALACDNAKAAGVTIYTVFVDLNGTQGNSAALQNCASDPSKYFDLTSASQIVTAFQTIGTQITNLRVAK